jgi:hypothetical protein
MAGLVIAGISFGGRASTSAGLGDTTVGPAEATAAVAAAAETVWLITPEEVAALEQQPGGEATRGGAICDEPERLVANGPRIELLQPSPKLREMTTPFSINIRFTRHGAPIDPSSLRVTARRQFPLSFVKSLDLTERVRQWWKGDGISYPSLDAPKGCYQIELYLADEKGHATVLTRGLRITKD